MDSVKNQFLIKNEPEKNLNLLANSDVSAFKGKFCSTEDAYKQSPLWNPSKETLREWTILAAAGCVLNAFFMLPILGMGKCMLGATAEENSGISTAQKCFQKVVSYYDDGRAKMIGVFIASAVGLSSIALYAGLNWVFKDSGKEGRFIELHKEYSKVAEYMNEQFKLAVKNNDTTKLNQLKIDSEHIRDNKYITLTTLQSVIHLTVPQSELLVNKLQHVADKIINSK